MSMCDALCHRTLQCMLLLQPYWQWCNPCGKCNCDAMATCIACLLQGDTALHAAAKAGHTAVVETMLLNGACIEARDNYVSNSSCICIIGIDTAYIIFEKFICINTYLCSKCCVLCIMPGVVKHSYAYLCCHHICNSGLPMAKAVVMLWQP